MRYLLKGNRLPFSYTYAELLAAFDEVVKDNPQIVVPQLGIGNNTVARLEIRPRDRGRIRGRECIIVRHHSTDIMWLWPDKQIGIDLYGFNTKTTKSRVTAALRGIGKTFVTINRQRKIYTIATGEYEFYKDGMLVQP